jgi:hypothetical protein
MSNWEQVFAKEISLRRKLYRDYKSKMFWDIHNANPKGLVKSVDCKGHCWVPASTLHIHDALAKKLEINSVKLRAFNEALTWTDDGCIIVPQMCQHCDATSEREIRIQSHEERVAEVEASKPKKERKVKNVIESSFDSMFGI